MLHNTITMLVSTNPFLKVCKIFVRIAAPMSRYCFGAHYLPILNRFNRTMRIMPSLHFYSVVFCLLMSNLKRFVNRFCYQSLYIFVNNLRIGVDLHFAESIGHFICRYTIIMLFYYFIHLIADFYICIQVNYYYFCYRAYCLLFMFNLSASLKNVMLFISSLLVGYTVFISIVKGF